MTTTVMTTDAGYDKTRPVWQNAGIKYMHRVNLAKEWKLTRIVELKVAEFRGISSPLSLDFRTRTGSACSVLLLGDNGTGKSSVADAFEFCLRGKVSRRGNAGIKNRREARNLLSDSAPSVSVTLDDGTTYRRGQKRKGFTGTNLGGGSFVPGFGLSPVVLSRDDIEVFWHLNSSGRMRFFFDYLRSSVKHPGYAALEAERIEEQIAQMKARILVAQIALSAASSWPVEQIPVTSRLLFDKWLRRAYPKYQEKSIKTAGSRRTRIRSTHAIPRKTREAIAKLSSELSEEYRLKRQLKAMREQADMGGGLPVIVARDLPRLLDEISSEVTADFISMARLDHVKAVSIRSHSGTYLLDIECTLSSGSRVEPSQVLSEGALDLLAILILLGVARACARRGQEQFLVLDDVWQSVDAVHRQEILDYLFSDRFKQWQFLITVHDRLWARLIENRARQSQFPIKILTLLKWSAPQGPQVRSADLGTQQQLSQMIGEAAPEVIGAYTGRALEELADELSQTMRTSVSRTMGDRYTLGDTWPGVYKALKKTELPQEVKEFAKAVDDLLILRNLYSAHYQKWAESFSSAEINHFAELVVALWAGTHCDTCASPLELLDLGTRRMGWKCGHAAQRTGSAADMV
jgi:AAA domain